jgi:acyl-CoA thioesterase II
VFGGALVGQAISAASLTVPAGFRVYSSQSSFLAPTNPREKIAYQVEATSDSRVYSTRLVHAMQGKTCLYIAVISFQSTTAFRGPVLEYTTPIPDLDGLLPKDIQTTSMQTMQTTSLDRDVPLLQLNDDERPFDWRPIGLEMTGKPEEFRIRSFVRSPAMSSADPAVHLAALAYMSDEFSFGPALLANPKAVGRGMRNVALGASLIHNITFHDPRVKVDEWLVLERETSWGAEGRVLVHQRLWALDSGRLVLSGMQEALIRLKGPQL